MEQAVITLTEGVKAHITVRDVQFFADEAIADGGTNAGPNPVEILTSALGACAAMTARVYARRKGWPLEGVDVVVTHHKLKAADYPDYSGPADSVNTFRQEITFHGPLTDEQRQRLLEIAGRCPVHRILEQPNFFVEVLADAETDGA
jgi:putative redox protein